MTSHTPEGTEPSGLTLQVRAVRQDGHYITYSESWNSGARKPMLCVRCSSSNWLNPDSNLYHTDLIEVSMTQRLMTLLSQIHSALPSKARPAILHVSRSWFSKGQTLDSTWRSYFLCIRNTGTSVVMVPTEWYKPKSRECNCQSCQHLWSTLICYGFSLTVLTLLKVNLIQNPTPKWTHVLEFLFTRLKEKLFPLLTTLVTPMWGFSFTLSNSETTWN